MQVQKPEKIEVVRSVSSKEFEQLINERLAEGWSPMGDMHSDSDGFYILMMKTKVVAINPVTGEEIEEKVDEEGHN